MSDATPLEYPSPSIEPPRGAMAAIFLIVLSDLLGFGLIIPSLPFYARNFNASDFQIGLIFAVYSLCQLIATPILGMASDRFGRRPVLLLSQIGSVSGYVMLAIAVARRWDPIWLGLALIYTSRVIDGISGGNISTAQAYVSDVTTPENRAKGMGMLGAAFGIGFCLGPALGGILAHFHPSAPAIAAAIASATAALMTWLRLREPARHRRDDETAAWLHPSRFLPIFKNPLLVQLLGIWFFTMIAFVMLESVFAIFLHDTYGFKELAVGMFFMFVGAVIVVVQGFGVGRLTRRFGEWPLTVAGPVMVASAMLLYVVIGAYAVSVSMGVVLILTAGLFNATGRSIQTPALSSLISKASDARMQGTVFGFFHMLGSLGRVIGPLIATAVYTRHHTAPFWLAGTITAAMAVWAALLWNAQRSTGAVIAQT